MGSTNTLFFCLNSQTRLDNLLSDAANPVSKIKDTLGTLAALKSPANMQGWSALPIQMPGRARPSSTSNRKVALSGRVRSCPTVETSAINPCAGSTPETTDLVDTEVQIGNYRGVTFTIDRNLYRDTCDTTNGQAGEVIAYKMAESAQQILIQENNDAVTAMLAAVGDYFSGVDSATNPRTIPLYGSSVPRQPQPGNLFHVISEYQRKGYVSGITPIGVGGTGLGRWQFDAQLFRGDVEGRDANRVPGGFMPYVDYAVDSIAADGLNHLLTWVPGHAQMLHWLDFAEGSPLRRSNGEITKTTMNIGGETFDVVVYDANCDDNVDVTISRYSQPYIVPEATFFSSTCGGEFTLLDWVLDCADTTCDDIYIPGNIIT